MLNLKFNTVKEFENKIAHGQKVVFFPKSSNFSVRADLRQGEVEFFWEDYDANGDRTGGSASFSSEDFPNYKLGDRIDGDECDDGEYSILRWMIDGTYGDDIEFIMDSNNFFDAFETAQASS